jgi:hypothetical protein
LREEERAMGVETDLIEKLKADPDAEVHLIVRLKVDTGDSLRRLSTMGLRVRHRFRLTRTVAVTGRAADGLALSTEPWVESIEEDKPVTTMS